MPVVMMVVVPPVIFFLMPGQIPVDTNCRSIHSDFPFLHFRLTRKNSILAHRCRLAYAACGMWKVPFIVIQTTNELSCGQPRLPTAQSVRAREGPHASDRG